MRSLRLSPRRSRSPAAAGVGEPGIDEEDDEVARRMEAMPAKALPRRLVRRARWRATLCRARCQRAGCGRRRGGTGRSLFSPAGRFGWLAAWSRQRDQRKVVAGMCVHTDDKKPRWRFEKYMVDLNHSDFQIG